MSLVSLARRGRLVAIASCALLLVPTVAMAKVGGGKSSGSRGAKTYQAPPSTNTAPTAAPLQRSATPAAATAAPSVAGAAAAQAARPSFARNMMMGIGAGLLGAGLFGLLSGAGLFSGLGGIASFLGLLMQVVLIGGLVWLAVRYFRRRQESQMAPVAAGMSRSPAPAPAPYMARDAAPQPSAATVGGAGSSHPGSAHPGLAPATVAAGTDAVGLTAEDFGVFERLLSEIQAAYSNEDQALLRNYATPEMVGYMIEDMRENAAKGLVDRTTDVKLVQGDLAEAWVEGDMAYATVAMRFQAINTLVERSTGKVVEGHASIPQESTELWTFCCRRGESWKLSAIQQPN